jgi:hypothetical protein
MKVVKVVVKCLAGLLAAAFVVYSAARLIEGLLDGEHPSGLMGPVAFGSLAAALSVACFQSAFRRPKRKKGDGEDGREP